MKIAIVVPHIFMWDKILKSNIFAPGLLAIELANRLYEKNHEVFLYSAGNIKTKAKVIQLNLSKVEKELKRRNLNLIGLIKKDVATYHKLFKIIELSILSKAYLDENKYQLIHVFVTNGPEGPIFSRLIKKPIVFTLHDPFKLNFTDYESHDLIKDVKFTSISKNQGLLVPQLKITRTIYNGIDFDKFKFNKKPKNYFAYYGRIIQQKGVHTVIKVCLETKNRLKIAGLHYEGHGGNHYWSKKILPYIDNKNIQYSGFLTNQKDKNKFLGNAKALLCPIEWDEPFCLAIIEANSCGTPVIAYNKGSIPEIVKNGINGFIVKNKREMKKAMKEVGNINRWKCREYAKSRFNIEKMVCGYENLYKELIH